MLISGTSRDDAFPMRLGISPSSVAAPTHPPGRDLLATDAGSEIFATGFYQRLAYLSVLDVMAWPTEPFNFKRLGVIWVMSVGLAFRCASGAVPRPLDQATGDGLADRAPSSELLHARDPTALLRTIKAPARGLPDISRGSPDRSRAGLTIEPSPCLDVRHGGTVAITRSNAASFGSEEIA